MRHAESSLVFARAGARLLLASALLVGGCRGQDRDPSREGHDAGSPVASATKPSAAPESALTRLAVEATRAAAAATADFGRALHVADAGAMREPYRVLRRRVARAAPFIRTRVQLASEVMFGPPRSVNESGGMLGALDRAVTQGDATSAARAVDQIAPALALAEAEIARTGVPAEAASVLLSDAAYELGALLLEALPDLPEDAGVILEVDRGMLESVTEGANALGRELRVEGDAVAAAATAAAPIRAELDRASTSLDVRDRGALALATGRLGAAIRALAAKGGRSVRLPYPPRIPAADGGAAEPVSILTLPAPRRSTVSAADRRALARVGRELFFDKRLSRGGVRACASCHEPARFFTDGLVAPASLDPADGALRHTPTLLYTSLHAAQLWDGSVLTAESQAIHVIHRRAEMGLSPGEISKALAGVPAYERALGSPPSPARVAAALVAFEVEALVPGDAPIDRLARGDAVALTVEQRRGLDVFAGKGRCARCHVPPLFGGSRPNDFAVPVFAVLGVPETPDGRALDPDRGRALVTRRAADEHAFKTPTVRDIARTAPYFHHGRFPRLEDVISFYDKGGGRGLGLDVKNQDPDVRPLSLTPEETHDLLSFLREALLDATPPAEAARPLP
ncbi:Cytochrome c551 peroxidase [Minicystis rosea]|nr:Cytochrome c551 peroxidase [Minicystis rosea]